VSIYVRIYIFCIYSYAVWASSWFVISEEFRENMMNIMYPSTLETGPLGLRSGCDLKTPESLKSYAGKVTTNIVHPQLSG